MRYHVKVDGVEREYEFVRDGGVLRARCGDETRIVDVSSIGDGPAFSLIVDGRSYDCLIDREQGSAVVQILGESIRVEVEDDRERAAHRASRMRSGGRRSVDAAMPGVVVDIRVAEGDVVTDGQTLVVLEAMKMQNPIQADGAGRVIRIARSAGDTVAAGDVLVELDAVDE